MRHKRTFPTRLITGDGNVGIIAAGCMQMQINVYDPKLLIEARDHPGRYPGLLVRVSGYAAYFDDLAPEMKEEMIQRTLHDGSCSRF